MSGLPLDTQDANRGVAPRGLHDALVAHYDDLVAYVRRRFRLGDGARDVVHDACAHLLARGAPPQAHNPVGLLRRMLHNFAVDDLRRADARRVHECPVTDTALPEQQPCPAPGPECVAQSRQELARLSDAIAALPPRCQEVFVLHRIHGMPQREVATLLRISPKTVEGHVHRGALACRAALR